MNSLVKKVIFSTCVVFVSLGVSAKMAPDFMGKLMTDDRMLKADAESWIEVAGLEIVEDSDLLRTNADDHEHTSTDPVYGRDVDRFFIVARKPN